MSINRVEVTVAPVRMKEGAELHMVYKRRGAPSTRCGWAALVWLDKALGTRQTGELYGAEL